MCCQVNLLEAMETMDRETFEFRFGEELVYTTMLSDGQMVDLVPGGSNVAVRYEDRSEFIRLVQKARLEESKQQVRLISVVRGVLKVAALTASFCHIQCFTYTDFTLGLYVGTLTYASF